MKNRLFRQLSLDYHVSFEEVASPNNVFSVYEKMPGRRIFRSENAKLKICSVNNKLIFTGTPEIIDWCKVRYKDTKAAWFSLFPNLKELDEQLAEWGETIADCHHFYLPEREIPDPPERFSTVWYEDVQEFCGDLRFLNALSFLPEAPDVLAVAAWKGKEILGMAGVSRDSEEMWQIGIDVLPDYRGMGIATDLVIRLKNEVLRRGKLPFYGTAETHIMSQRVAVASGFVPAWSEIYTVKKKQ